MTTASIEDLHAARSEAWDDIIGGSWLHAKGTLYTVTDVSVCSETKELLVTYREVGEDGHAVYGVPPWTRPRSMWKELVEAPSGTLVPRFQRITGGLPQLAELRALRGL